MTDRLTIETTTLVDAEAIGALIAGRLGLDPADVQVEVGCDDGLPEILVDPETRGMWVRAQTPDGEREVWLTESERPPTAVRVPVTPEDVAAALESIAVRLPHARWAIAGDTPATIRQRRASFGRAGDPTPRPQSEIAMEAVIRGCPALDVRMHVWTEVGVVELGLNDYSTIAALADWADEERSPDDLAAACRSAAARVRRIGLHKHWQWEHWRLDAEADRLAAEADRRPEAVDQPHTVADGLAMSFGEGRPRRVVQSDSDDARAARRAALVQVRPEIDE